MTKPFKFSRGLIALLWSGLLVLTPSGISGKPPPCPFATPMLWPWPPRRFRRWRARPS